MKSFAFEMQLIVYNNQDTCRHAIAPHAGSKVFHAALVAFFLSINLQ